MTGTLKDMSLKEGAVLLSSLSSILLYVEEKKLSSVF